MSDARLGAPVLGRRAMRYARLVATVATLLIGLAVTVVAYRAADRAVRTEAARIFGARATDIRDAIHERMATYAQVLRGARGFFAGSDAIERHEWRAYVEALRIETTYPGIQALGVAESVPAAQLAEHERRIRAGGLKDYAVNPAGERAGYTPVIYVEPMSVRNVPALGFDLISEPTRRAALAAAVESGEPALSGRMTLITEKGADLQYAVLMVAPVFRRGFPLDSVTDRQTAVWGYVYAPFRVLDLLGRLLGPISDVRVEIFDGASEEPDAQLYDSTSALGGRRHTPRFASTMGIVIQGRLWTLRATSLPQFERQMADDTRPRDISIVLTVISLMMTALVWSLATSRERAMRFAERMTEELRESRERLSLAMEGSNLAMFDWNVADDSMRLSPRWNAMLGGEPEETITTLAELRKQVHPDDAVRVRGELARALAGETAFYQVEHRVRMHDGTWKWILSHGKVVAHDRGGRALRFTGVNADISERKAVEDMKNEFIGTVSHELRSPLTSVIGALALLKEEYGDKAPPEAAAFLDMAYQNSERLAMLVNDILDLEKVDAGALELDLEAVAVKPFLEQAAALNAPYATQHGTRFEVDAEGDSSVFVDRARLMQVLTNLMTNAAKHSPAGEPVVLRARADGACVRLEVVDRGPGIPAAFQPRVFERFAQADGSDARSKGGTGLGLPLAKAMTEAMAGEIGFDSIPGKSTTFYVILPLAA